MGRKRRTVVRRIKKKLPEIFLCPTCGEEAINIVLNKDENLAEVKCSKCQIKSEFYVSASDQIVDIYCKFTDKVYSGSI